MMSISPSNPIINQILKGTLTKDVYINERAYDYDNCMYFVSREEGSDLIKFCFKCNCSKEILANGGQEVLNELYKDYQLPASEHISEYDITLGIDTTKLPKT